ncbi:DUF1217 domain-containing protein [Roseiterribacter gracilis]|uniref:Uncharacterized protein n=1 Tax=Roseiterribacter gracilis TaxID=2812848 RepID=A0A8S8X6U9_9PROT|nr:hypothetical protein TMPK1_00810 [Rhodospirillales bacterium TMPK1]
MSAISVANWQGILKNQQTLLARSANSPAVKGAIDYFRKNAPKIQNVDQLLKDKKLLGTILTTYGLEADAQYPAKIKALLTQDPKDPKSLVNRLIDSRYTKFVVDLSFSAGAPGNLQDPKYADKLAQTFAQNTYEKNLGNQDPALREAAYFLRNIGNVTDVFQILGDRVLRDVVFKALQLPDQFGTLDIEKQAAIIKQRLNLKDLQGTLAKNAQLFSDANADNVKITDVTKLSQAASAVVKSVSSEFTDIENAYKALAARQDPLGVNAAKITQQNGFVADLARVRGLLDSANARIADIPSSIDRLQQIITAAPTTTDQASFDALKTEFDTTVTRLQNNLVKAGYINPSNGNPESLIAGTPASIAINLPAGTVTFNSTDLSSVLNGLSNAKSAFDTTTTFGTAIDPNAATNLATARTDTVAGQAFLAQQGGIYSQALTTIDPNISASQQSLIFRADFSTQDALQRIAKISSKLITLQATLETAIDPTANHAQLNTQVQQLKADIETLIKGNGGGTDNLLTADGGYGSEEGIPLSIRGADLLTQLRDRLKDVNAFTVANATSGSDLISKELRPYLASRTNIIKADSAYVQSAAASAPFVITPDTAQLRLGTQSAADSLSRATTVGSLLGQLRSLAQSAFNAGDGSAQNSVDADALIQSITDAINTPGSGLDNLLVGGGVQNYNFIPGAQLGITKGDLANTITSQLASIDLSSTGSSTAAKNAIDLINSTLLPALADAKLDITTGSTTIDTARKTFDPRAALDDRFTAAVANITTQVQTATVSGKNLLTSVADSLVFLKSTPGTYAISGHGEFDQNVTKGLQNAVTALLTNSTSPLSVIHSSLLALTSISIDLSGDASQLKFGSIKVQDTLTAKAKAEAAQLTNPYTGTTKAKLIANQFLAFNADTTTGANQSLADLLSGSSNTNSILNLLI